MSLIIHGFGIGLLDFFAFWLCTYFASQNYKPAEFWRWVWFVGFIILALLFLLAFVADIGGHI